MAGRATLTADESTAAIVEARMAASRASDFVRSPAGETVSAEASEAMEQRYPRAHGAVHVRSSADTSVADEQIVDPSAYAFAHGLRRTRGTLAAWRASPAPVLRRWIVGSGAAAVLLLGATALVALFWPARPPVVVLDQPPLTVGGVGDVAGVLGHNLLVLALHAMACVAGFIAGSSLPLQARYQSGLRRWVHERGRWVALAFVGAATTFSLSMQAYTLGRGVAGVASALHVAPLALLLVLTPHALPELMALFLPLAAWLVASRRGEWDQLLAATAVTTTLSVPVLVLTAVWEVFGAPHLVHAVLGGG